MNVVARPVNLQDQSKNFHDTNLCICNVLTEMRQNEPRV